MLDEATKKNGKSFQNSAVEAIFFSCGKPVPSGHENAHPLESLMLLDYEVNGKLHRQIKLHVPNVVCKIPVEEELIALAVIFDVKLPSQSSKVSKESRLGSYYQAILEKLKNFKAVNLDSLKRSLEEVGLDVMPIEEQKTVEYHVHKLQRFIRTLTKLSVSIVEGNHRFQLFSRHLLGYDLLLPMPSATETPKRKICLDESMTFFKEISFKIYLPKGDNNKIQKIAKSLQKCSVAIAKAKTLIIRRQWKDAWMQVFDRISQDADLQEILYPDIKSFAESGPLYTGKKSDESEAQLKFITICKAIHKHICDAMLHDDPTERLANFPTEEQIEEFRKIDFPSLFNYSTQALTTKFVYPLKFNKFPGFARGTSEKIKKIMVGNKKKQGSFEMIVMYHLFFQLGFTKEGLETLHNFIHCDQKGVLEPEIIHFSIIAPTNTIQNHMFPSGSHASFQNHPLRKMKLLYRHEFLASYLKAITETGLQLNSTSFHINEEQKTLKSIIEKANDVQKQTNNTFLYPTTPTIAILQTFPHRFLHFTELNSSATTFRPFHHLNVLHKNEYDKNSTTGKEYSDEVTNRGIFKNWHFPEAFDISIHLQEILDNKHIWHYHFGILDEPGIPTLPVSHFFSIIFFHPFTYDSHVHNNFC